jgi:hypothetical protein
MKKPKPDQKFHVFTWDEIYDILIPFAKSLPDYSTGIWGIPRGGAIVAALVSHIRPDIEYLSEEPTSYAYDTIIIDDILDSGFVFMRYKDFSYRAALVWREGAQKTYKVKPTHYGKIITNDDWIVFPWEQEAIYARTNISVD